MALTRPQQQLLIWAFLEKRPFKFQEATHIYENQQSFCRSIGALRNQRVIESAVGTGKSDKRFAHYALTRKGEIIALCLIETAYKNNGEEVCQKNNGVE